MHAWNFDSGECCQTAQYKYFHGDAMTKQTSHGLIWLENAYSRPLFRWVILSRKVGQDDLVFGIRVD